MGLYALEIEIRNTIVVKEIYRVITRYLFVDFVSNLQ